MRVIFATQFMMLVFFSVVINVGLFQSILRTTAVSRHYQKQTSKTKKASWDGNYRRYGETLRARFAEELHQCKLVSRVRTKEKSIRLLLPVKRVFFPSHCHQRLFVVSLHYNIKCTDSTFVVVIYELNWITLTNQARTNSHRRKIKTLTKEQNTN